MYENLRPEFDSSWIGEPNSGCWLWDGKISDYGYGTFYISKRENPNHPMAGKILGAHRLSYMLYNGEIPASYEVCHKCDTPSCVRPDHLFAATHSENMQDRNRKGRCEKGVDRYNAKLTEDDVIAIRRSSESIMRLADKYGVVFQTISEIKRNITWSHVPEIGTNNSIGNLPRGASHHRAKLTDAKVIDIRALCKNGATYKAVAAKFGVTDKLIGMIVRRKIWRHVSECQ